MSEHRRDEARREGSRGLELSAALLAVANLPVQRHRQGGEGQEGEDGAPVRGEGRADGEARGRGEQHGTPGDHRAGGGAAAPVRGRRGASTARAGAAPPIRIA